MTTSKTASDQKQIQALYKKMITSRVVQWEHENKWWKFCPLHKCHKCEFIMTWALCGYELRFCTNMAIRTCHKYLNILSMGKSTTLIVTIFYLNLSLIPIWTNLSQKQDANLLINAFQKISNISWHVVRDPVGYKKATNVTSWYNRILKYFTALR